MLLTCSATIRDDPIFVAVSIFSSVFFLITLGLELSDTKKSASLEYEP